ncbi:hypothetical protein QFC22_000290 [Naganishia vaughanmartiniae]|uniref:Uncharacterized protein n=1 Tax=Naganishia vaughanmartiniae TaxID=1424756 RepID=A0ACC2XMX6_9TREE|nr:hypothetical protein QFC22_000290 [Naganishia vaughanmartiniae]
MATSITSDNRPPYFYPASPANDSALQHCSTNEIQLASTSMTGIDGYTTEADSHFVASRSTILPALLNNTSMSILDREDYGRSMIDHLNTTVIDDDHSTSNISVSGVKDMKLAQKSDESQQNASSASRTRAFGLARRLSKPNHADSAETSRRGNPIADTAPTSSRKDTNMIATTFPKPSIQAQKTADLTTTFSSASPLPDIRSITTRSESLSMNTPLSKHLIAARGIMKDPRTPGSGQSVRFFSRDVYQTSSVTDFESTTAPHATSSTDSPAGVMSLSNLENTQSLFVTSSPSLPSERTTERSITVEQELCHLDNQMTTSGDILETSPPRPISSSDDSRLTRRTASDSVSWQQDVCPHEDGDKVNTTRKSDVFGDALAVVPQFLKPTSFPPSPQSASSISVSHRSFDRSNLSKDASSRSILGNSTQANITVYPPGAYKRKVDIKEIRSNSISRGKPTSNDITARVRLESSTMMAPLQEIIVLDDSSDLSASCANSTHRNGHQLDETVYLTPESSRRGVVRSGHSHASGISNISHELPQSQASEGEIVENVFLAHRRELRALKKDRDGWKHLCTSLMEVAESTFSLGNRDPNPATPSERESVPSVAQESLETHSTVKHSSLAKSEMRRTSASVAAADAQMRDNLRDMQIRLQSKQKECDQQRSRADRCEVQVEAQQQTLLQMRQENDVLVRDTRDIDVKLELHARERESRVRQQLAEQIHDLSSALQAALERNEALLLTIKQQGNQIGDLKSGLEAQKQDLEEHRQLAHEIRLQAERESRLLLDLGPGKGHVQDLENALQDREDTIRQLQLQLEEEPQARIHVATQDEIQSLQEILAKEFQRNNELASLLEDQDKLIRNLQENNEQQQSGHTKEMTSRDQRIRELESAYSEKVEENRDQYLQLEEAIEEREAKYTERLRELEVIADGQEHDIQRLQATNEELQSKSTTASTRIEELQRIEKVSQDREKYIAELSQTLAERSQKIKQYEVALADWKRKAADDVFESTKRERRIEKLLDDREMLNIAVEQLQIQIQLVKRQYKARTGKAWDEETSLSQDKSSRMSAPHGPSTTQWIAGESSDIGHAPEGASHSV